MNTINAGATGSDFKEATGVTVDDASNYVATHLIIAKGKDFAVNLTNGAGGAIAAMKITRAMAVGGTHKDLVEGTGFNTATDDVPNCLPTLGSPLIAANGTVQFRVCGRGAEYKLWFKKSAGDTTIAVELIAGIQR